MDLAITGWFSNVVMPGKYPLIILLTITVIGLRFFKLGLKLVLDIVRDFFKFVRFIKKMICSKLRNEAQAGTPFQA